jgi:hypothetical protein
MKRSQVRLPTMITFAPETLPVPPWQDLPPACRHELVQTLAHMLQRLAQQTGLPSDRPPAPIPQTRG